MIWCFITEPNGIIHELVLPKDARAGECLDKVCTNLHLVEKDYFGLRYTNPVTHVDLWLNLRNKLDDQLIGKPPHRFQLLVKFFVKPQELQQQITRELFYLAARKQLIEERFDLNLVEKKELARLYGLIGQIEFGRFIPDSLPEYSTFFPCYGNWSDELERLVEEAHINFGAMSPCEAKVEVLHILSRSPEFGVESFNVYSASGKNVPIVLSVRYDGLRVYKTDDLKDHGKAKKKTDESDHNNPKVVFTEKTDNKGKPLTKDSNLLQFIPYEEISTVSYKGKLFTISYGDVSSNHQRKLGFKLKVQQGTINLFRTFTEYHSFYQCNVVKKSVMEKCTRNSSAGRVACFFRPRSQVGRVYLFDVMRTRRQTYNHVWKELNAPEKRRHSMYYSSDRWPRRPSFLSTIRDEEVDPKEYRMCQSVNIKRRAKHCSEINSEDDNEFYHEPSAGCAKLYSKNMLSDKCNIQDLSVEELQDIVRSLKESRTCQVCMDAEVSTAFCPCGHAMCCVECAVLCKECPLCRAQITYAQRVFFSCA